MIRLVPVLLLMAAVVGGAGADPACLPNCDGENLLGRDLRFANMAGASLRGAALTLANAARADLSGADLSFANSSARGPGSGRPSTYLSLTWPAPIWKRPT